MAGLVVPFVVLIMVGLPFPAESHFLCLLKSHSPYFRGARFQLGAQLLKVALALYLAPYPVLPEYITPEGLDVRLVLQRFQAFMREHFSERDTKFLEREGRLLFLSFLRPSSMGGASISKSRV